MTKLTTAFSLSLLSLVATAACGKSSSGPTGVPCDAKAIDELSKDLYLANGLRTKMSDEIDEKAQAAAKAKLTGKKYAFKGCTFKMQGNDQVSFGATGTDKDLDCTMKGGEAGVKDFRHAAMKYDMDKLKLDVSGTIGMGGTKGFERLGLTNCTISAHE